MTVVFDDGIVLRLSKKVQLLRPLVQVLSLQLDKVTIFVDDNILHGHVSLDFGAALVHFDKLPLSCL